MKYLDLLCQVDNMNIFVSAKSIESKCDKTVEWYDTKYCVSDFTPELKKKMTSPNCTIKSKKLALPPANNLIAKSLDLLGEKEEFSKVPLLIKQWPDETDLWYKKDDTFKMPKAQVKLKVYTNDCLFSVKPEGRVFAHVWATTVTEYLREFNYMADLAKLDFGVSIDNDCIDYRWSGFNDSMPNYITETLSKIVNMKDADLAQIFDQVKEKLLLDWSNFYLEQSFRLAAAILPNIVVNLSMEKKQLIKHLETFTFDGFKTYLKDWLKTGRSVWFITGNYDNTEAIALVEKASAILKL
jgi:insulysin